MKALQKYIKILSVLSLIALIVCMIPLCLAGFYTHPLGDDYFYGYKAATALREGQGLFGVLKEAFKGMVLQYRIWQGTYSAMFLMHLPPNLLGDIFYKLYPSFIIIFLTLSVFYVLRPLIVVNEKITFHAHIAVSSLLCIFMLEEVPNSGESFYWYNGSMYYTGFLAVTFIYFGLAFRYLKDHKTYRLILLSIIAFIIGGGNYASVLPAILLMIFLIILAVILYKKEKKNLLLLIPLSINIIGLFVSMLAPGNAIRGNTVAGMGAAKAIAKSILACANYAACWNGIIFFVILALLTPVFIYIIKNIDFKFHYSYFVCPVVFGIFSSSECATFYAQGNGGPARLFDICFYMTALTVAFIWFYLCGAFIRLFEEKKERKIKYPILFSEAALILIFLLLLLYRPLSQTVPVPNSFTACKAFANGDMQSFDSQYKARMKEVYDNPNGDLVFSPYEVSEDLIYFLYLGDMSKDPTHHNNVTFCRFHDLNSVVIDYPD